MLIGLGVLVVLVAAVLVLRALEPSLLFHPRTDKQDWCEFGSDFEELTLADGTSALWCPLAESEGTVLYCHGNFGNISMRENWVRALQEHLKASIILFDPPGYGKTTGKPTEAGCYASAESALGWLKEREVGERDIILWGKSLGAALAIELAVRHPECRALVLIDPFSCIPDAANVMMHAPVGFLARNRFDNARKIGQITMPKVILGAELDTMCPCWMAQKLGELAREPKALLISPGREHAEFLPENEWRWIGEQLAQYQTSAGY